MYIYNKVKNNKDNLSYVKLTEELLFQLDVQKVDKHQEASG